MAHMTKLPVKTYADIMACDPCYDPAERGLCTCDWQGTALDVLRAKDVSSRDKLWLVLHSGWIDDCTLRLFACGNARLEIALTDNPNLYSIDAVEVAERYAYGEATKEELRAARVAVWRVTRGTVWAAAWTTFEDASVAARGVIGSTFLSGNSDAQVAELERRLTVLLDADSDNWYDDLDE